MCAMRAAFGPASTMTRAERTFPATSICLALMRVFVGDNQALRLLILSACSKTSHGPYLIGTALAAVDAGWRRYLASLLLATCSHIDAGSDSTLAHECYPAGIALGRSSASPPIPSSHRSRSRTLPAAPRAWRSLASVDASFDVERLQSFKTLAPRTVTYRSSRC